MHVKTCFDNFFGNIVENEKQKWQNRPPVTLLPSTPSLGDRPVEQSLCIASTRTSPLAQKPDGLLEMIQPI